MEYGTKTWWQYLDLLRSRDIEVRSLVVWQGGKEIFSHAAAPFALGQVHPLYSVTKSFTSCAVGLLVEEGRIGLATPWISYFPEYRKDVADPRFLQVTVRDLLTMQLGQDAEPYVAGDDDWAKGVAGKLLAHDPGTAFLYNSMCSHLLSLLVERASGKTEEEFLAERLFEPLGITQWWWEQDRQGHTTGGFGLHLATPDLAKFGQCLLDGGKWEGRQVIPERWIHEATAKQAETRPFYPASATEDRNGYGYQFWMCANGGYRCSGLFGQLCYVLPEEQLVVAASSATDGSKPLMDALYEVLAEGAMQEEVPAQRQQELAVVAFPEGTATSPRAEKKLAGVHGLEPNREGFEQISFGFEEGTTPALTCRIVRDGVAYEVRAGHGTWLPAGQGSRSIGELFPFATAAAERIEVPAWDAKTTFGAYAWTSPSTLAIETREADETRRCQILCQLDGNHLVAEVSASNMYCGHAPSAFWLAAKA